MYLLLILAAFLFAVQFLFNQQYRRLKGEGLDATMTFSLYTSAISFVILFALGRFQLHITACHINTIGKCRISDCTQTII